jgi:hypothetical protein
LPPLKSTAVHLIITSLLLFKNKPVITQKQAWFYLKTGLFLPNCTLAFGRKYVYLFLHIAVIIKDSLLTKALIKASGYSMSGLS